MLDSRNKENLNKISNLNEDSIEIAFFEGNGTCNLINLEDGEKVWFSNNFERDGIIFPWKVNRFFFSTIIR